jgi:hypothetical protein
VYGVSLFWLNVHDLWEVLRSGVDIAGLVGFVCFAYHRAIGTRTVWRIWLLGSIAIEFWTIAAKLTPVGWELWVSLALVAPLYYGLGVYAFGAEFIWRQSTINRRKGTI